ncbi:MAG: hypothetical protein ACUVUP_03910 [Thermaceae bacterium]
MKRALASLLTLALAACSVTVTVRLPEQTLDVTSSNTAGKIIYPKNPLTFSRPPVQAKRVEITGEANLSPHTPLSLVVYARTSAPAPLGCLEFSNIYICDEGQKGTYVGEINFMEASHTSFTLGKEGGETLAQGVNQGQLWLGVKVEGTGSLNSTLTLKEMEATVTVQF